MREGLTRIWNDFSNIPILRGVGDWQAVSINHDNAPHARPRPLRDGRRAIYVFYHGDAVLKVGQTNYSPRFTSQHYGSRRAGSTLAKDLENNRAEFGIQDGNTQAWMFANLGRSNFVFPAGFPDDICRMFECFLHHKLNPWFEGRRQ